MSDQEHFLKRWSRRKLEPEQPQKPAVPSQADEEAPPGQTAAASADPVPSSTESRAPAEPVEPAFDLTRLPSLDSIEAGTDITGFLKPGVPPELTRAALRRAWVADPAIRNFVGLSENSWDFNSGAVPGFGSIGPEDVARLLTRLQQFASADPGAAPAAEPAAPKTETTPPAPTQLAVGERAGPAAGESDARAETAEEHAAKPASPRHGRALPR